jgi:uncharacterized membrane protein
MKWFNIVGLIFDLAGVIIIALSVVPSRGQVEVASADRRKQSTFALVGLGLLVVGFILQIIGGWPR